MCLRPVCRPKYDASVPFACARDAPILAEQDVAPAQLATLESLCGWDIPADAQSAGRGVSLDRPRERDVEGNAAECAFLFLSPFACRLFLLDALYRTALRRALVHEQRRAEVAEVQVAAWGQEQNAGRSDLGIWNAQGRSTAEGALAKQRRHSWAGVSGGGSRERHGTEGDGRLLSDDAGDSELSSIAWMGIGCGCASPRRERRIESSS